MILEIGAITVAWDFIYKDMISCGPFCSSPTRLGVVFSQAHVEMPSKNKVKP